ncbi:MAG: hypothetical protein IAE78_31925, partial [Myxococcus sp.]|nr:hypothetical protein [Myxococcus sp.]
MKLLIPALILLAACGPQLQFECSIDSQCGVGLRCQANQCVGAPTATPPPSSTVPVQQSVANDTCETATVANVGVTRGTTRGAKRDYSPMGCYQPAGNKVPTGSEVVFRFRPPQHSNLKFSVRSLSQDFTPALYLTISLPTCAQAIESKNCSANPLAQTYVDTPELFVLVGSTTATEGDFELTIEATLTTSNQGGGSAGGGAMQAGGSTAGGAAGGSAPPAVTARAVWESQSDVRELSGRVRDYHLGVIRNWSSTARQTAGANNLVFFGTLTETATDVYRYASTPSDRLQVNRLNGAQFSFTVQSLVGNLASAQFPGPDESITFVFRNFMGALTGRVAQRGAPGERTREWSFQGVSWTSQNDTEVSTLNIQYSDLSSVGSAGVAIIRSETGSVVNTQRSLSWSSRLDSWTCSTCSPVSYTHLTLPTT